MRERLASVGRLVDAVSHDTLWRLLDSPPPTQKIEFDCEMVTSPIEERTLILEIASKVVPLFDVFHTPPCAVAT